MDKVVVYPFRIDSDFFVGYAWAAELTRRLKKRLSLFTTIDTASPASSENIYHALAIAQGFYVKNFQLLQLRLPPVRTERNFVEGNFTEAFLDFVKRVNPVVTVLQSGTLSPTVLKRVIGSGHRVILLQPYIIPLSLAGVKQRSKLFIDILRDAAFYNIPGSFFKTLGKEPDLYQHIASVFRKSAG